MDPSPPSTGLTRGTDVAHLRSLVMASTHRLLADTAAVADPDWRQPSRLPGWSRAHVATHLARQADALARLVQGALTGRPQPMYASAEQRNAEIASGAGRRGPDLQADLEVAAGALSEALDTAARADAWDLDVELRGGDQVPVRILPLARLSEVVLHHVDLDVGFDVGDIDERSAEQLLTWCAFRLRQRDDFPRLLLVLPTGAEQPVGSLGTATSVSGPSAELLGWLTGRSGGHGLSGGSAIDLPSFG